jgi:predicted DNA-binding transcriptional regulator AlpA
MELSERTIIRMKRMKQITGFSDGTIRRKAADPLDAFPSAIQLSPCALGWYEDEALEWRKSLERVVKAPQEQAA